MGGDILFIVHRVPFPPDRGDKIRSYHLLKALAALGPVHLAAFADDARDMAVGEALASLTASRCIVERKPNKMRAALSAMTRGRALSEALFDDARLHTYVADTIRRHAIRRIVVFSGQMAHYVPADYDGRFVMDFVDVDSAKFAAYADSAPQLSPMRAVFAREGRVLARREAEIARRADVSLFVSAAEAALFQSRAGLGADRVRALENGIDTVTFDPTGDFAPLATPPVSRPLCVFTGQMDYRPNIDAVVWFAQRVLPLLRNTHADAGFAIVGRAPTREVEALGTLPGVTVTGAVDDVRSWIAAADVVVAPLLLARGIQNKVLEAMAMAKPVVASPAAAEGIDATPGVELAVAQSPADMVATIAALVRDPDAAQRIGQAARARMLARYGWDAQLAALPSLLNG